jgi:hypothetical protein
MDARTVEKNKKSRGGVKPSCFRFKTFYESGWRVDTPATLKRFLAYATLQIEGFCVASNYLKSLCVA